MKFIVNGGLKKFTLSEELAVNTEQLTVMIIGLPSYQPLSLEMFRTNCCAIYIYF